MASRLTSAQAPKNPLRFPLIRLFEGVTVPIEPVQVLDIFDEVVERSKRTPTMKIVLRFEIWPAATPQWLASVMTSTNNAKGR